MSRSTSSLSPGTAPTSGTSHGASATASPRQPLRPSHASKRPQLSSLADDAVRRLYREHRLPLLRYVSGLLRGDLQRAEDIVQETLVRAWVSTGVQPAGWTPSRAWLCRVAHNLVIDLTRSEQARPDMVSDHPLESHPSPVDEMGRAIERHMVMEALSRLSHPHREVLVYVYLLGCTGSDTADELGIPPGTVRSRVYYAMRELRRSCGPQRQVVSP
jgi:RNA polymerase sigma-70 factor (ECF subfamily)